MGSGPIRRSAATYGTPGPTVGKALTYLLGLRMEHGPLGHERAVYELLRWAAAEGLDVPDGSGGD